MNDFVGVPNFKNIDIHEELADAELGDIVTPDSLVARLIKRRSTMAEGIKLPFEKLAHTDFLLHKGSLNLIGGYTGHFKSTISSQIGLRALRKGYRRHRQPRAVCGRCARAIPRDRLTQPQPNEEYVTAFAEWAKDKLYIYDRWTPSPQKRRCRWLSR